jgi:hypothetical protein
MRSFVVGLVVGAVLMDSWRVAREVQIGRELRRMRETAAAEERQHRRADIATLAGPVFVDGDGERWR